MTPSWITPDFAELLARRDAMPGVERHQTTYVRYKRYGEAQVAQMGWDLQASRRSTEQLMRQDQLFLPDDHMLFSQFAPENVNVKVVEAPAEFAVPVKQDRRLSPSFRLRVEVKHRNALAMPLTLRAYVISQQEKDNILNWHPDTEDAQKAVTELKGTTCITHHFEAGGGSSSLLQLPVQSSSNGNSLQQAGGRSVNGLSSSLGISNSLGGGMGGGLGGSMGLNLLQANGRITADSRESSLSMYGVHSLQAGRGGRSDTSHLLMDYPQLQTLSGQPLLDPTLQSTGLNTNMLLNLLNEPHTDKDLVQQMLLSQGVGGVFGQGFGGGGLDTLGLQEALLLNQRPSMSLQQQPRISAQLQQQSSASQQSVLLTDALPAAAASVSSGDLQVTAQEFEFANLEFLKPTRMNKVYMVFACNILDMDTLFVVYNIPTIGICRAEQREKACQKLGVSFSLLNIDSIKNEPIEGSTGPRKQARDGSGDEDDVFISSSKVSTAARAAAQQAQAGGSGGGGGGRRGSVDLNAAAAAYARARGPQATDEVMLQTRSRQAMRDWILEEYEITGLTRKLGHLDMQALLSQAGFPMDSSSEHATISDPQWNEFTGQFKNVLSLLRQIASVWNLEDPCVISGFDMDRQGTVQALVHEPAGTFICRFSMSQPGCLVLTCKTGAGHPNADADGLIHAIIKIDDLYERRVDTWIRDFAGATHVLDVYRQKRVDKRKIFASNYTRLKDVPPSEAHLPAYVETA